MTDDLVEKVARALWHDEFEGYGKFWDEEHDTDKESYRGHARAALSAIEDAGWCVVPVEPTDEMYDAALASGFEGERRYLVKDYAAMLSARPRITGETT